jgi:beta-glucanase (GH16 family)
MSWDGYQEGMKLQVDIRTMYRSARKGCSFALGILTLLTVPAVQMTMHAQSGWKLVWNDEFDGARGAAPDPTKWKLETGAGAAIAGNQEAEMYCDPTAKTSQPPCNANQPNAYLDGAGHLVIVAVRTDQTVTVGDKKTVAAVYTSARMHTLTNFRYGRIEASIRIPAAGDGIWPAFWALGQATQTVKWPATGEIDVIEQWNPLPSSNDKIDPLTIHGAVHGPKAPGSEEGYIDRAADYVFPTPPSGGLHQYAIEWGPGQVDFYVDGYLYERQSLGTMTGREVWEEDRQPFALLLNLAMGGGFFGYPSQSTGSTPTMVVDYVRVYQKDSNVLPKSWGNYDVGGPSVAGTSVFHDGVYRVAGGGFGIAGRFDQFQFAYRSLGGDGEATAHVLDQTSKVAQAKAGVMQRAWRCVAVCDGVHFARWQRAFPLSCDAG